MTGTHDETPIFETSNHAPRKNDNSALGYLLLGVGAFFLIIQFLPSSLFLPLLFISVGAYFLRQDKAPLYFTGRGRKFTRGHAFLGVGLWFLLTQMIPSGLLVPLALVGIGYVLLRRRERSATI